MFIDLADALRQPLVETMRTALIERAGILCSESAILLATTRAIRSESLTLKIRAQEARGARHLH